MCQNVGFCRTNTKYQATINILPPFQYINGVKYVGKQEVHGYHIISYRSDFLFHSPTVTPNFFVPSKNLLNSIFPHLSVSLPVKRKKCIVIFKNFTLLLFLMYLQYCKVVLNTHCRYRKQALKVPEFIQNRNLLVKYYQFTLMFNTMV